METCIETKKHNLTEIETDTDKDRDAVKTIETDKYTLFLKQMQTQMHT